HHRLWKPPRSGTTCRERRVRPHRACGQVKDVGKPCKGEPYARIDGGRLETEAPSTVTTGGTTQRETAGMKALGPTDDHATAPASYPPRVQRARAERLEGGGPDGLICVCS